MNESELIKEQFEKTLTEFKKKPGSFTDVQLMEIELVVTKVVGTLFLEYMQLTENLIKEFAQENERLKNHA